MTTPLLITFRRVSDGAVDYSGPHYHPDIARVSLEALDGIKDVSEIRQISLEFDGHQLRIQLLGGRADR